MALEPGDACWHRVEFAQRLAWPLDPAQHAPVLLGILPWEWDSIPCSNLELLTEVGYRPIADYSLATPYGQRRFQVRRLGGHTCVLIVKEVCPTPLLVSCTLAVWDGSITAAFCLMSGAEFTTCTFVLRRSNATLRIFELEDAAREAALQQDLLESRQQKIQLLLHGFSAALPDTTPVWPGGSSRPKRASRSRPWVPQSYPRPWKKLPPPTCPRRMWNLNPENCLKACPMPQLKLCRQEMMKSNGFEGNLVI